MSTGENWLEIGSHVWFYREVKPTGQSDRLPVLLLHGLVSQSYSWREVMPALAGQGFRAIAPDWPGYGFSGKPDRRDFAYTPDAFVNALSDFVKEMGLEKFSIVAQGYLGSVGIQYALRHPQQVDRLAIFNAPVSQSAKLPWRLRQMGIPLIGDMLTQDPLLVDRTLEGGGGYRIEDKDLDIYRRPWLKSSDAGRSLLTTIQKLQLKETTLEIETGLSQWTQPLLLAWGVRDPWLPISVAEAIVQANKNAELVELEEVGHYPQEDWPEKVSEVLLTFLRRL
ncbi:alpha/beta fold hydrolase [Phormidesmis priestleyi]